MAYSKDFNMMGNLQNKVYNILDAAGDNIHFNSYMDVEKEDVIDDVSVLDGAINESRRLRNLRNRILAMESEADLEGEPIEDTEIEDEDVAVVDDSVPEEDVTGDEMDDIIDSPEDEAIAGEAVMSDVVDGTDDGDVEVSGDVTVISNEPDSDVDMEDDVITDEDLEGITLGDVSVDDGGSAVITVDVPDNIDPSDITVNIDGTDFVVDDTAEPVPSDEEDVVVVDDTDDVDVADNTVAASDPAMEPAPEIVEDTDDEVVVVDDTDEDIADDADMGDDVDTLEEPEDEDLADETVEEVEESIRMMNHRLYRGYGNNLRRFRESDEGDIVLTTDISDTAADSISDIQDILDSDGGVIYDSGDGSVSDDIDADVCDCGDPENCCHYDDGSCCNEVVSSNGMSDDEMGSEPLDSTEDDLDDDSADVAVNTPTDEEDPLKDTMDEAMEDDMSEDEEATETGGDEVDNEIVQDMQDNADKTDEEVSETYMRRRMRKYGRFNEGTMMAYPELNGDYSVNRSSFNAYDSGFMPATNFNVDSDVVTNLTNMHRGKTPVKRDGSYSETHFTLNVDDRNQLIKPITEVHTTKVALPLASNIVYTTKNATEVITECAYANPRGVNYDLLKATHLYYINEGLYPSDYMFPIGTVVNGKAYALPKAIMEAVSLFASPIYTKKFSEGSLRKIRNVLDFYLAKMGTTSPWREGRCLSMSEIGKATLVSRTQFDPYKLAEEQYRKEQDKQVSKILRG